MVKTVSLVIAMSLLVNDVHFIQDGSFLESKYFPTNLVHLVTSSLIVKEIPIFPKLFWRGCPLLCSLSEVAVCLLFMEASLRYVWNYVREYILRNSDDLLAQLTDDERLDWLLCRLCCGQRNCSEVFAALVLKVTSFAFLLGVCCFHGRNDS
ncbi:uncharacterized protein LOC114242443 [Bombyx mandarina]|uniref:Uncharacterized protein LOC114242443 n=1 Tax=Bombyx mandarina TaxID=7092 RepID=A0A6J2JK31_BOMMA|nr:uncharacterized protein LOC114242443 [Bombyx mandarina]